MTFNSASMVWHGWGDPARRTGIPPKAMAMLRKELGLSATSTPPVGEPALRMRPSALPDTAAQRLTDVVGPDNMRTDREARLLHAGGKSYPDLLRRRTGDAVDAPDAVVLPGSHDDVVAVLAVCAEEGIAVVPFGGGTSVVGGVEPVRGRFPAVIALDLSRLDRLVSVDRESLTATMQAGLRGPQAEELLNQRGLTLGHFPQSYEHATIGGYAATRSAGQASTGYGRFDELVVGVRMATPTGELLLDHGPASAAGPDLRAIAVGSEGVLGIITEVTLHVRPTPDRKVYEGWLFRNFHDGATALRRLAQERVAPDVVRLSDEHETRVTMALANRTGSKARLESAVLRARGYAEGCLVIVGWEGTDNSVRARRKASTAVLKESRGLRLGEGVGEAWEHGRFNGPYLRDELMDRGVFVETLETAAPWSKLHELHQAVRTALNDALTLRGTPPIVMCHISHVYESGGSLYFTFAAAAQQGQELDQWRAAKTAASKAIVATGATITHHHAVGTDHAPYLSAEVGDLGIDILKAVKARLDPTGILNPGKLIP
ncbi:MAG: alkyldihydroxyacetonephosphate synthase [Frankiales bacterium]|jgi:alkyldihydroxyacetonephosphate synthase|nr:alkyldihydroxyacetonephosphate synthase [Frankiales bacterium]